MSNEKCCEAIAKEVCVDDKNIVNIYFGKNPCNTECAGDSTGGDGSGSGDDFTEDEITTLKAVIQWANAELDKEYWTGKSHIDGKRIYGKKIECGPTINGTTYAPHNILNIERVTSITGMAEVVGGAFIPLPSPASTVGYVVMWSGFVSIAIRTNRDDVLYTTIILEYTCTDR